MTDAALVERAIVAIDEVNAADPVRISVDGVERPKEVVHAEHMTRWIERLDPHPSDAQRLAARAHHLRRWALPRTDFPEGRAGYHRWRSQQRKRQAAELGELLAGAGIDAATIERAQAIVAKEGLGRDREVQVHEDALCLTFLELQYDALIAQLGEEHTVEVLVRTLAKMSPTGVEAASSIELSDDGARLLQRAVARSTEGTTSS